jgi:hypothetical protein
MSSSTYRVFGLSVSSEIELPELDLSFESGDADVVISLGTVPEQEGEKPGQFTVAGSVGVLNIPGAGRYLVPDGRQIVVEPDPNGSERHLRLYLLGSVIGAVLHQKGLLPLHSNAVEVDGRALAFTGPSGAGKSTMAAWFHDNGYNVLADDVCVVTQSEEGVPLAQPGIPRLRLWRDALESSGRDAQDHEHAFDDADKYNVKTRASETRAPVPLGAVYVLDEPNSGAREPMITRLTGVDAVDALVANTYRGAYVRVLGETKRHLMQCLELARTVPIFRMERVWGFDAFANQARLIEEHSREFRGDAVSS